MVDDHDLFGEDDEDAYDDDERTPLLSSSRGQTAVCSTCGEPTAPGRAVHPMCVVATRGVEVLTHRLVFNGVAANYEDVKRLVHVVRHYGREAKQVEDKVSKKRGDLLLSDLGAMGRSGGALALDLVTVCGGTIADGLYSAYEARNEHGKKATARKIGQMAGETGLGFVPYLGPFYGLIKGGAMFAVHATSSTTKNKINKLSLCSSFLKACDIRLMFAENVVKPAIEDIKTHSKYSKQKARYEKNINRIESAQRTLKAWAKSNIERETVPTDRIPLLLEI